MTSALQNVDLVTIERVRAPAKRKSSRSPTELSLAHMRKQGCVAQVVEKWNPHARVRSDLFGCVDVLCLHPDGETIAVQATSRANVSSRVAKIAEVEHLAAIRRCGWRLVVHGWDKYQGRYRVKEVDVS